MNNRPSFSAAITGVGVFVPENKLTNADIEKMVDTTDEWIFERSGVRERRILNESGKGSGYLGFRAVQNLIEKTGIDPLSIELIIFSTATPDHQFPATANEVAHLAGATRSWSFDLMGACSGFLYALQVGRQFIESGAHKRVVVVGADKMSSVVDYTDRRTCILFGDGGGAVLLEADYSGNGMLDARLYTEGSAREFLYQPAGGSVQPASVETVLQKQHFIHMSGQSVFKVAVQKMADAAEELMQRNGLSSDDVAFLVPHQANKRIIEATAQRMGIGMNKVMLNIERYGNTTCATIPLCLAEWENQLHAGDKLILTTFGAGFTWGGIYLRWAYNPKPAAKHETAAPEAEVVG
jgi:3-oxoacyl-[acyl-carrier-protein] synthase III